MRGIIDRLGAVRLPLFAAAVLTLSLGTASAQVVEQPQTWDALLAQWPCNNGLTNRIARVMDADSTTDIGGGGGSTQVWVQCDGVDTWSIVNIGGGAGGSGDVVGPASSTDNAIARFNSTTGKLLQDSALTVADSSGNLQWEGTTADAFEGNFTFADPTADWTWAWGADGALTGATQFNLENLRLDGNTISTTNTDGDLALAPNGGGDVTSTAQFLAPSTGKNNGDPGYSFVGDSDTGIYDDAANNTIKFTAGGSRRAYIGETAFALDSGVVAYLDTLMYLTPAASPPIACNGGNEGYIYTDTSHALCWCDGTTYQKLSGAGTCA